MMSSRIGMFLQNNYIKYLELLDDKKILPNEREFVMKFYNLKTLYFCQLF